MPEQTAPSKRYRGFVLFMLTLVYGFNFIDRQIVGILAPFIQADLGISNTQLGLLIGFYFALFYTIVAIPIAWLADRYNRINILSIALATWSGFTALTGLATNFWQIGMARMGVGIGEAGGSPPSHSIISDLYPKEERASALGIYSMGIPFGIMAAYFAAASLIGSNADDVNWRSTFIFLGVSGILLSILLRLLVREPVRGAMEFDQNVKIKQPPFFESLKVLLKIPAWWAMCLGIAFGSFVSYSFAAFQTKYIILLDPGFNFKTALIVLGIVNGTTYAGGSFFGAKLADKWGSKTVRAYGWIPALGMSIALPIAIASFWITSVWSHLALATAFLFFIGIYLGPSFAVAQTLAPINMRAMSTALFFFILNMIALGGGPTFAGWMIDVFKASHDDLMAMRYAMTVTCLFFIPSIICFLVVAKLLPKDWQAATKRNAKLAES